MKRTMHLARRIICLLLSALLAFAACAAAGETAEYASASVLCSGDCVSFLTCCGGRLYGLFESGLYRVEPSGEKTLVAASSALRKGTEALLSDGDSVYAAIREGEQALLLRLTDGDGTFVNETVLTLDLEAGEDAWLTGCVLRNGYLYYPVRIGGPGAAVVRVNLPDGTVSSVTVDNLVCFDVLETGDLLAETREPDWPEDTVLLKTVSPETGEAEPWADPGAEGYAFGLRYDAETGKAYLRSQREICAVQKGGEATGTGLSFSRDIGAFCLLPQGIAASDGVMLKILAFGETAAQKTVLSFYGFYAEDEYFTDFYETHPGAEIRQIDPTYEEPEDRFIRDVLTQNPDVDVYILHDLNLLSLIKSKGYYADLSGSEVIREKVSRMYAPFIRALTDGDRIAAFPHPYYVFFSALNYHRELFQELALPVPTTWEEYFDFCVSWKNQYENEHPGISVNPFEHELTLVTLLEHYDDEMTRAGLPADYLDESLKTVLRKYLQVKELYPREVYYSGKPLFYDYDVHLSSAENPYDALPLTFVKGAEPIYTPLEEDVHYFVVNPFGTHVKEAIECIASAKDPNRGNEPFVYQEIPDLPLKNAYYEEFLEDYQEQLDMLNEQKTKAEDDPAILLEVNEKIDSLTKEMQDYAENMRFWFTEEDMLPFREIVSCVYFSDFNPVKEIYDNDPGFFDNVTEENLDSFLLTLNGKVSMCRLERE